MEKASYNEKVNTETLKCLLCPNACLVKTEGYCKVRVNQAGELFSKVINRYSVVAIDPIEKKPLYNYYPGERILSLGSIGCNFRCKHCQNWEISQPQHGNPARELTYLSPANIIDLAIKNKLKLIAFTYNEPTINLESIRETAILAKPKNLKIVSVTNGYLSKELLAEMNTYIDAYSIDLKAFDRDKYIELTGVDAFAKVKEVIERLVLAGKHIELVTNLVTGINDNMEQLIKAGEWIYSLSPHLPWHLTIFQPKHLYANKSHINPQIVNDINKWAQARGLSYVYSIYNEATTCPCCKKPNINRRHFEVLENHTANNKCDYCGQTLPFFENAKP